MDEKPVFEELGNNTLLVNHAGYGVTPPCSSAKFRVGQVLKAKWRKELCSVAAIVPPGFPPEYALADLTRAPRPLMITKPKRGVSYIVGFVGDTQPHLYRESHLRTTAEPDAPVQWMNPPPRSPANAP